MKKILNKIIIIKLIILKLIIIIVIVIIPTTTIHYVHMPASVMSYPSAQQREAGGLGPNRMVAHIH